MTPILLIIRLAKAKKKAEQEAKEAREEAAAIRQQHDGRPYQSSSSYGTAPVPQPQNQSERARKQESQRDERRREGQGGDGALQLPSALPFPDYPVHCQSPMPYGLEPEQYAHCSMSPQQPAYIYRHAPAAPSMQATYEAQEYATLEEVLDSLYLSGHMEYFNSQGFRTQQQLLLLTPGLIDSMPLNMAEKLTLKDYISRH